MHGTTRDRSRRRLAPLLLIVLAITVAWTPAAPAAARPAGHAAGSARDDVALLAVRPAAVRAHPPSRDQHPERTFAAPARTKAAIVPASAPHAYSGENHFWIPSLGLSQRVYAFPCTRAKAPVNVIYRWGCAGRNNVYIFGHAYGVMKPLHDAYVAGRLHVGMLAIYADAHGNIRSYRVTSWRVVDPTEPGWAIADQPVPSMTLQTCLGARSQWRLNVRLVAVA